VTTLEETLTWRGQTMTDSDGSKIGTIEEIYLDADSGQPEWALVNTGLFGTKRSFVPLRDASASGDGVRVPFSKDQVKDAPVHDAVLATRAGILVVSVGGGLITPMRSRWEHSFTGAVHVIRRGPARLT